MRPGFLIGILYIFSIKANSQQLKLNSYNAGYRLIEIEAVGNNPSTITPFLKNQAAYRNFLSGITYNGIFGNPGIQQLHLFYLNFEFIRKTEALFWRRLSLQTGFNISNKLVKSGMGLADQGFTATLNDSTYHDYTYWQTQEQQFIGANIGLNKNLMISKNLFFLFGINFQGSLAIIHRYRQRLDTFINSSSTGIRRASEALPSLAGKNFFQWYAMIPVGLEFKLYKNIFLRTEINAGIISDKYRRSAQKREATGFGVWVIYKNNQRQKGIF